jgi:hypothetical protein
VYRRGNDEVGKEATKYGMPLFSFHMKPQIGIKNKKLFKTFLIFSLLDGKNKEN